MYCQNCGKALISEEKFCMACGTAVPVADEPTEQAEEFAEELAAATLEEPAVQEIEAAVVTAENVPTPQKEKKKTNIFAIIGFVVSLVCFLGIIKASVIGPLAGLIFSIVALVQIKKNGQKGKGLAVAGVILGAIATLVSFVTLIVTAIFSYAVPGFFRLLLTYVFPELFSMLGDYVGEGVSEAMNSFWSDTGAELIESIKAWFESLFQ